MTDKSHQRPHGHHHEPHPDQAEAQAKGFRQKQHVQFLSFHQWVWPPETGRMSSKGAGDLSSRAG